jgi:ATP-binding cassette, subfamily F, member 3
MLHINDLTFRIEGRTLIDGATIAVPSKGATGFVGRNGTGKTSLFRIITGEWQQESGTISLPKRSRIGSVAQEAPSSEQTLIEVVLAADLERSALLAEADTATDPYRIADIQLRLADIDAYSAEARASSILTGLGFDYATQLGPCSALSGGWRMRVALAATLFSTPDLLLLDEPTNYLDLEGTIWLENYLARYPYAALVISHDRELLNRSVQAIMHLEGGKLTLYKGGYDRFERQRAEQQALQLKLKKKQDHARRHMEEFVARFRAKANKASQAQSRIKALERMQPIASIIEERTIPIELPSPVKELSPPLIQMDGVSVGYNGAAVLHDLDLHIGVDDRIALLGKNGNGKSTLAKLLSKRLQAMGGRCKLHHKMEIAYFAQHQLDEMTPGQSAKDHVRALMPDASEAQVRARTARIGLGADKMDTKVADLSGGEKARLLLALATFNGPHLLILDEPTNHLDVDGRQALVQAMMEYQGAVVLISHDQHFVETCAERLWLVDDGTVTPYEGDMSDYRRFVLDKSSKERRAASAKNKNKDKAGMRRETAKDREALAPLRKEVREIEKQIARLEKDLTDIDKALADPGLYEKEPDAVTELGKKRSGNQSATKNLLEQWISLSAELEDAKVS